MNLNKEERNGYVISEDMKKIWNIQLLCVKKVLDVCQKHNLQIWAEGGTLLGTIRHSGYIPWDDDIDLVMMRDDYNKLLKIASSEFEEPYFFQSAYTDKCYPRGHSQVRYNGTAAILPGDIKCKFNQSIFIDIFVYDNLPANKFELSAKLFKSEFLRRILFEKTYTHFCWNNPKNIVKKILLLLLFLVIPFKKLFKKFDTTFDNVGEDSGKVACVSFTMSAVFSALQKSCFSKTLYMPFEDIMMPVPVGYDDILTELFGDYMMPAQAPSLHGSVIFDSERPYTEVLKDIKSGRIDIKKYLNE